MDIKTMFIFSLISGMVGKRKIRFRCFGFLLLTIFVLSCKKESSFLDVNIIPEDKRMETAYMDSMAIESYTVTTNSLQTSNPLANPSFFQTMLGDPNIVYYSVLGSMADPVFGKSSASFLMQFAPTTFPEGFAANPIVDEVVLKISFDAVYGDAAAIHRVRVYPLIKNINPDTPYLSNHKPVNDYYPYNLAGICNTTFNGGASLRINLDNGLGDSLLRADSAKMSTVTNFLNFFNGLYITTDQVSSGGSFGIHKLPTDSLFVYYHYEGSSPKSSVMSYHFFNYVNENDSASSGTKNLASITMFSHDYTSTSSDAGGFVDKSNPDSLSFVHGLNGAGTKIILPDLSSLREKIKQPSSVHYAELIIKADINRTKPTAYPMPVKLVIAAIGADNQYYLIDEKGDGTFTPTLSANYDSARAEYRFIMTDYIHNYLIMKQDYNQFIVAPFLIIYNSDKTEIASGLFMPSGAVLKKPVLKIFYNTF